MLRTGSLSRIDPHGGNADEFGLSPGRDLVAMRDVDQQLRILRRGVEAIVPEDEFLKKLERSVSENIPLRVKYGIDPTGINVHLGHTVPLRKLRQFQELGHTAVIILGNYTALVGDPSGRDETRMQLTPAKVAENAKDYLRQVGRIIDIERAEVHENGSWFSKWSFLQVLDLTRQMTLSQITTRDDFAKRMAAERPVYLHECLYPLMQGWDSVEVRADVELGGSEQLFSFMVARHLQKSQDQAAQAAVTMPILVGTDGTRRMGKSLGNDIGLGLEPNDLFGKIMSIPDEPLRQYFTLLTDMPLEDIDRILGPGVNPRDAKDHLAQTIISGIHTRAAAEDAAKAFRDRAGGNDPEEIPEVRVAPDQLDEDGRILITRLLVKLGLETSTSNARRLIEQGGVTLGPDRTPVTDPKAMIASLEGLIVRVGKRKIVRVVMNPPT